MVLIDSLKITLLKDQCCLGRYLGGNKEHDIMEGYFFTKQPCFNFSTILTRDSDYNILGITGIIY